MKLSNMIFIIMGLQILFWLAGINQSMGESLTLLSINSPADIATGWFFSKAALILAAGATASIVIGLFTKASTENALIAVVAAFFINFVSDFVGIIMIANSYCEAFTEPFATCAWVTWIVVAILLPLTVVFVMACFDWWRGNNS